MTEPHNLKKIWQTLLSIPPNFSSICFGLAGLAGVWHLAGKMFHWSMWIGLGIYVLSGAIFLLLLTSVLVKLVHSPRILVSEFENKTVGPFYSLLPITGMLLSFAFSAYAYDVARDFFLFFFSSTLVFGGLITGQWIYTRLDIDDIHPGYYLPAAAGGLIGGDMCARFGFVSLGWMSFGIGIVCAFILGTVIMVRVLTRPVLPPQLIPLLAIEIAPPVVGGSAYFTLTGNHIDMVTYLFAGYAVLMVLVQLRLVPLYSKTSFSPGFWAFTFSFCACASYALQWIAIEVPTNSVIICAFVVGGMTFLVGSIGIRSLIAIKRHEFLPHTVNP